MKSRITAAVLAAIISFPMSFAAYAEDSGTYECAKTVYAEDEIYINEQEKDKVNVDSENWIGWSAVAHYIKYDISSVTNIPQEAIESVSVSLQITDRAEFEKEKNITGSLYSVGTDWEKSTATYNKMKAAGVFDNMNPVGECFIEGGYKNKSFNIDITDYYKSLAAEKKDKAAFKFTTNNVVIMKRRGESTTYAPMKIKLSDEWIGELVSGMNTSDVDDIKDFLTEYGTLLGISEEDLKNNIDSLALAYTGGKKISSLDEFMEIYSNYEEIALMNIIPMINRAKSAEEFDDLVHKYSKTLGLSLLAYDSISDKGGIYKSVAGVTDDKDRFIQLFNDEVGKYCAEPVTIYATDEVLLDNTSRDTTTGMGEGWIGPYNDSAHYIKYDISALAVIDPDRISAANVTVKSSDRSELDTQENITETLYRIGTDWNQSSATYNIMEPLCENAEVAGSDSIEGNYRNTSFTIDVTGALRKAIAAGESKIAFKLKANNVVLMTRRYESETYAPLRVSYVDSGFGNVDYSIENGSVGVSIDTDITLGFENNINADTLRLGITLSDSDGNSTELAVSGEGREFKVKPAAPLKYETQYSLELSKKVKFADDDSKYVFNSLSFITEKVPFEFKGMTLKSGTKVIEKLSDRTGNKVTASAVVNNNSCDDGKKLIMMIGLYENTDTYSKLADIKTVSTTLEKGQSISLEKEFTLEENKNYNIVCNVWDSLTGMNTLFEQAVK